MNRRWFLWCGCTLLVCAVAVAAALMDGPADAVVMANADALAVKVNGPVPRPALFHIEDAAIPLPSAENDTPLSGELSCSGPSAADVIARAAHSSMATIARSNGPIRP